MPIRWSCGIGRMLAMTLGLMLAGCAQPYGPGQPARSGDDVIGRQLAALRSEDCHTRASAAEALGGLGDRQATAPLTKALSDPDQLVRIAVAKALGCLNDPKSIRPLIAAQHDQDREVAFWATKALATFPQPEAIGAVVDSLVNPDPEIRGIASRAIRSCLSGPQELAQLELACAWLRTDYWRLQKESINKFKSPVPPPTSPADFKRFRDDVAAVARTTQRLVTSAYRRALTDGRDAVDVAGAFEALGCADAYDWKEIRAARVGGPLVEPLIGVVTKHGDFTIREGAAVALAAIGDPRAVGPIATQLRHERWEMGETAAWALGILRDRAAYDPLVRVLADPAQEEYVRAAAARALGRLGDRRAVDPLLAALEEGGAFVQADALMALADVGDPRAIPAIVAIEPHQSTFGAEPRVGEVAMSALGRFGDLGIQALLGMYKAAEVYVADEAPYALAAIGEPAIGPAMEALGNAEPGARPLAAEALGAMTCPVKVPRLLKGLKDPCGAVRLGAAMALVIGDDPRGMAVLLAALGDNDPQFRLDAANVLLNGRADARAIEPLNHILVNDTYADIVATAGYALGLIKDGRASGALLDCLRNNQSPMRRGAAIEGLRNVEGAEATTAIEAALGDADPGVRRAAAEVLGSRGDKNSHGLLLKLARDDPDEGVRKAASEAAERTGPKAP